jgi:glycosyltransferase involved in cell wall biosynthesis
MSGRDPVAEGGATGMAEPATAVRSAAAADAAPEVTILLALHNGAAHLGDQLDSFAAQTHRAWSLLVSDDGSADAGPAILERFRDARHGAHAIWRIDGPRQGFAQNFLHLLRMAPPEVPFVALSDQDDVWHPEKLARGVAALSAVPAAKPALFCANWMICNADLSHRRPRRPFRRPPAFANALVQNIASGNSIMLNRAGLELLQQASRDSAGIFAHDWWIYQMITGAGGEAIYDPAPLVLYRQHDGNAIGSNHTLGALWQRARLVAGGRFRTWNDRNVLALSASAHHLTPEARRLLRRFARARRASLPLRLRLVGRAGLYRQDRAGTAALWVAALFGRL